MNEVTPSENHQLEVIILEAPSILEYLKVYPDAQKAYENEVLQPMEKGEFPGKLTDTLPNDVQAYYLFLSNGEMVCYQANGQYETIRKYFVQFIVPSEVIENEKSKRLVTKTLGNANNLITSVVQVVQTHKKAFTIVSLISAIVRFLAF